MATLITDPDLEKDLLAQRRAWGADRYDEVWEGVHVMAAMPNDEHQGLVMAMGTVFQIVVAWANLGRVRPGVNVTDRPKGWKKNYRVPDLAVFLDEGVAENRDTHWFGGPDFGVEIISPADRTWEKIPFYEKVGTRELLIVDRDPWALALYTREDEKLVLAGRATLEQPRVLESALLSLTFELLPGGARPQIRIRHRPTGQEWLI